MTELLDRARELCQAFLDIADRTITVDDGENRIRWQGEIHSGPPADAAFSVIRACQKMAREILAALSPPAATVDAINALLAADPACNGRVSSGTVEAIAALTLSDAVAGERWQPIETAPRDGTRILLWTSTRITESDIRYVEVVCGGEHLDCAQIGEWDWPSNAPMRQHDGEWSKQIIGEPTHWQPLPAPPAAAIRKEPS